jgi:hypothetical protein
MSSLAATSQSPLVTGARSAMHTLVLKVYYIDGQNGLVSDTHPYDRQFNSFEFWRTA